MKIICIGRNYPAHAEELGNKIPSEPVVFLKPDTAMLKGADFYIPEFSQEIHYETEIVLKISKGGKYIQQESAHKHFEEIAIGFDFTARDLQEKLKAKGLPWEICKSFDGSAVVSGFFPKNNIGGTIRFSLQKNKETVQTGSSADMLFSFNKIIAYVSQYFTLRVGDLIFTGTPEGVGDVSEGDLLEAFLEDEKVLTVKVH